MYLQQNLDGARDVGTPSVPGMPKYVPKLEKKLRKRLQELSEELQLRNAERNGDGNHADDADLASHVAHVTASFRLHHREEREAEMILVALERIRAGTYGKCLACTGKIGRERLEEIPTATLCVECKSKREEREHSR